jgi:cobalt-zinc-cadmium efflux system protein
MSANHDHQVKNYNSAFAIGVTLNIIFVVIEAVYGVISGSLALIADAGHNLSDVIGLLLAWGAIWLAAKAATEKRTYGFRKGTVLASLGSALLLLFSLGAITWEAIGRLSEPQAVHGMTVIVVAAIGVVINTITALLFMSGQKDDLNIKGAYLHMAADAGVSLGVVVAGIIGMVTGWLLVDPITSLIIVVVIFISTWSLLRDSLNLALDSVPEGIDIAGIRKYLSHFEQVSQIHDLHVWAISTSEVALSVHLIMVDNNLNLPKNFLSQIQQQLHDDFGIEHATIQLERQNDEACMLNENAKN